MYDLHSVVPGDELQQWLQYFGFGNESAKGSLQCVQSEAAVTAHAVPGRGWVMSCVTGHSCVCVRSGLCQGLTLALGVVFGFVTGQQG